MKWIPDKQVVKEAKEMENETKEESRVREELEESRSPRSEENGGMRK